jgi:hypothetical protein
MRLRFKALTAIAVLATVAATAQILIRQPRSTVVPVAQSCEPSAVNIQGKYWINNNTWGSDQGSGRQCTRDISRKNGVLSWATTWNWTGRYNAVKSYASVVLGWHWGYKTTGTGLPIRLSQNKKVRTGWRFRAPSGGTYNVSYDLWLHTRKRPTWQDKPTDEVMVWLRRSGGAGPIGSKVATIKLGRSRWELWEGDIGWKVYSFVRVGNVSKAYGDLKVFLNYLVAHRGLARSKYLTSVEAGTEVFTGSGTLTTLGYYTTIEAGS